MTVPQVLQLFTRASKCALTTESSKNQLTGLKLVTGQMFFVIKMLEIIFFLILFINPLQNTQYGRAFSFSKHKFL